VPRRRNRMPKSTPQPVLARSKQKRSSPVLSLPSSFTSLCYLPHSIHYTRSPRPFIVISFLWENQH
jgi:hypothetical protein